MKQEVSRSMRFIEAADIQEYLKTMVVLYGEKIDSLDLCV